MNQIKPDIARNKRTTFSPKTTIGTKLEKLEKCPEIINLLWLKLSPIRKTHVLENTNLYRINWQKRYFDAISYASSPYLHYYSRRTLCSHMFDDIPAVSHYGKLSAQFHVGRSRLIDIVRFLSFFKFLARTMFGICLKFLQATFLWFLLLKVTLHTCSDISAKQSAKWVYRRSNLIPGLLGLLLLRTPTPLGIVANTLRNWVLIYQKIYRFELIWLAVKKPHV